MDKDKAYIFHIIDEISNIEKFVIGMTFESFVSDLKTAKAVERALEIIGEASRIFTLDSGKVCLGLCITLLD